MALAGRSRIGIGLIAGAAALAVMLLPALGADGAKKVPKCFGETPTIVGTKGNDKLRGTNGDDVIVGLGGKDNIGSKDGDDLVCSNGGNDLVNTSTGEDKLKGGGGADVLHGVDDDDLILGGPGDDTLLDGRRTSKGDTVKGQGGDDVIRGGVVIYGGGGNDEIFATDYENNAKPTFLDGGPGNDLIEGDQDSTPQSSRDEIHGGPDDDTLNGLDGNDEIFGDAGNDDIDGGQGTDDCQQGPGAGTITNCE